VNKVFSFIFLIEMMIKQLGLGFKGYFNEAFNCFDCFIVLISTIDLAIAFASSDVSGGGGGAISAMRAFRLLRVFKLAKSWKEFQVLLLTIIHTMHSIAPFCIILLIFLFIYTLLGMELFAFKAKFDGARKLDSVNGTSPLSNFDNFIDAFASVFAVLVGDCWSDIFFDYYRAYSAVASIFFFITLLPFG